MNSIAEAIPEALGMEDAATGFIVANERMHVFNFWAILTESSTIEFQDFGQKNVWSSRRPVLTDREIEKRRRVVEACHLVRREVSRACSADES